MSRERSLIDLALATADSARKPRLTQVTQRLQVTHRLQRWKGSSMGYRPRTEFDKPTAESVQRSRRSMVWFLPLIMIQQGTAIFREGGDRGLHVVGVVAWACVSLAILGLLLGLPLRWLSERDQTILNAEWNRSVTGDASRWGMVAMVALGLAILIARALRPI